MFGFVQIRLISIQAISVNSLVHKIKKPLAELPKAIIF